MAGSREAYEQAMNRGHSAAWDQNWEDASGFYSQALEEFPDDPKALINLGLAFYEMHDFANAMKAYIKVARITPDDPIPVEKVAQISERLGNTSQATEAGMQAAALYLKKGDVEKAIENWTLVTRLDPEHVQAHSRLALTHEKVGRKEQAVTEYLFIASILQHNQKLDEAEQLVNHSLKLMPGSDKVRQAMNLLQNGKPLPRPTRVVEPYDPFVPPELPQLEEPKKKEKIDDDLNPIEEACKAALAELANALFELSEEEAEQVPTSRRGLQEITRGAGDSRDPGERSGLIYGLRQTIDLQTQGDQEMALEELEAVHEMGLEIPAIFFDLGYLYAETGRIESGMRNLQRAVGHRDYALGGRLLLGKLLEERGRLEDAAVEYLEALRIADSSVVAEGQSVKLYELYEPLIEAYMMDADEEEHRQLCDNVTELLVRPSWRLHLENARRELPVQNPDAPSPIAEILTQARSGQIVGALTNIHQHARQGHLRVAMDEAFQALDYAPTYLPLHSLMGDLLLKQDRLDAGVQKYTMVAKAYSARGEALRAQEIYAKIRQLAPMDLDARQRLINELIASGDMESALREYVDLAEVYIRLAELATARKTFSSALQLAQQANLSRVWGVQILHSIADIDMQRLDWRQALRVYDQVRQIDPADEKARTNLIDLNLRMGQEKQALAEMDDFTAYLQQSGRQDDALNVLTQLASVHADNPAILKRLAQLYEKLDRQEEAISQWDRVGELCLQAGDHQGALTAVQSIINLNPPNLQEYQRLYEELSR